MCKLGFYQHFRGGLYLVLGTFKHTETYESFVAYVGKTGFWVRPLSSFKEEVVVDGFTVLRFSFLRSVDTHTLFNILCGKGEEIE